MRLHAALAGSTTPLKDHRQWSWLGWLCLDPPTTPEAVPEQVLPQVGIVAMEHLGLALEPDNHGRQLPLAAPVQLPHAADRGP